MVATKTVSWHQKKRLMQDLKGLGRRLAVVDEKLMTMVQLTEEEVSLYDETSTDDLAEKVAWLGAAIKKHVGAGNLTAGEKRELIAQVDERVDSVEEGSAEHTSLLARREKLSGIRAKVHPLKHARELEKLFVALVPLEKLEGTGRLLDASEMRQLGKKGDLDDRLAEVADDCRCVASSRTHPLLCRAAPPHHHRRAGRLTMRLHAAAHTLSPPRDRSHAEDGSKKTTSLKTGSRYSVRLLFKVHGANAVAAAVGPGADPAALPLKLWVARSGAPRVRHGKLPRQRAKVVAARSPRLGRWIRRLIRTDHAGSKPLSETISLPSREFPATTGQQFHPIEAGVCFYNTKPCSLQW